MPPVVLNGPQYLAEGLKLMLRPGLRLFVLLPLLVDEVLLGQGDSALRLMDRLLPQDWQAQIP